MTLLSTRGAEERPVRTTTRRFLVLLCIGVVLVRAAFLPRPLWNDEGGYLFIARHWHTGGEFLYGDYFVDRPPLLMLIFRIASLTAWDQAIRLIAIPFAVLFVLAGWRSGSVLGGRTGGRWAALVAAGVICSPGLGAEQTDGELFGAVFVMVAIALALSAWNSRSTEHLRRYAAGAGATAVAAALIKQNLLEGGLCVAGLVAFGYWGKEGSARRRAVRMAPPAVLGALVPCAAVWLWLASAGVAPATAWRDLVAFRSSAFDVIWSISPHATITRAEQLLVLGIVTGVLPLVSTWFARGNRVLEDRTPERWTITALAVFGVAAMAAGGSYWPSYLLQLAPVAVLAVGATAPLATRAASWMRAFAGLVVAAAAVGTIAGGVVPDAVPSASPNQRLGEWLSAARAPGDTGLVAYGLPSLLETADMASPYPYLWSVPMRTLDPDQERLRATLAGPRAPTWIVDVTGFDAWRIDQRSRLRELIHQRYRTVAEVCGRPVLLRQDVTRKLSAPPPC